MHSLNSGLFIAFEMSYIFDWIDGFVFTHRSSGYYYYYQRKLFNLGKTL